MERAVTLFPEPLSPTRQTVSPGARAGTTIDRPQAALAGAEFQHEIFDLKQRGRLVWVHSKALKTRAFPLFPQGKEG